MIAKNQIQVLQSQILALAEVWKQQQLREKERQGQQNDPTKPSLSLPPKFSQYIKSYKTGVNQYMYKCRSCRQLKLQTPQSSQVKSPLQIQQPCSGRILTQRIQPFFVAHKKLQESIY
ncbi:unnamed protein product [Paramecium octaurelia]|uniref:Uncharacterized protein n=1 Tax=Paramecium octaurelia TaxID=43137 RepID=A0A8S1VMN8_PAROT|nr:unnamed protein product [Paramecium octaurelia]